MNFKPYMDWPDTRPMWHSRTMNVPNVIKALLQGTGWTQGQLAERIGVNQNYVSRWLNGVEPRGQNMEAIRRLAIEQGVLDQVRQVIPVMGYVGAGGDVDPDFEQVPPDGLEQIELPEPIGLLDDPIGFLVRGDSMMPRYHDGDIALIERDRAWELHSLLGQEAVVMTYDGRRYLKKIMPGDRPFTYNLVSINAPTIVGVRIRRASPVRIIIPNIGLRRVPVADSRPLPRGADVTKRS